MVQLFKPWERDPIEFLVWKRFPLANRVPSSDAPEGVLWEQRQGANNYRTELKGFDRERIRQLVAEALEEEYRARDKSWVDKPVADFEHYARLSYWTLDEALALSFGKEPASVRWNDLSPLASDWPIAAEVGKRREVIHRAKQMGQLWDQTIPNVFMAWAERMGFPMPQELASTVRKLGIQVHNWKDLYEENFRQLADARKGIDTIREEQLKTSGENLASIKQIGDDWSEICANQADTINTLQGRIEALLRRIVELENAATPAKEPTSRERQSLLKIAIAMAIKKYRYDPAAPKNSATANIATHLRELGIPLDEDTIRKYLNEAKELLGEK